MHLTAVSSQYAGSRHKLSNGESVPFSLVNNTAPDFSMPGTYHPTDFPFTAGSSYHPAVSHMLALSMKLVYERPEVIKVECYCLALAGPCLGAQTCACQQCSMQKLCLHCAQIVSTVVSQSRSFPSLSVVQDCMCQQPAFKADQKPAHHLLLSRHGTSPLMCISTTHLQRHVKQMG